MSDQRCRHPGGTPAGGQFALQRSQEVDYVALEEVTDEAYNARCSYEYPPPPRSARQSIAFWRSVEIPDHVLRRIDVADQERFNSFVRSRSEVERLDRDSNVQEYLRIRFPILPFRRYLRSSTREEVAAAKSNCESWAAVTPGRIPRERIRNVVTAAGLHWNSRSLPEHERTIVDRAQLPLDANNTATPREIMDLYNVDYLWESF